MNYFVEVTVQSNGALITKHEPARDWNGALVLAQNLAVKMFPEDPMASRLFRAGRYAYTNRNDFGEPVIIRPVASTADLPNMVPTPRDFSLVWKGCPINCSEPPENA